MQMEINMEEAKIKQGGQEGQIHTQASQMVEDQEEKVQKARKEVNNEMKRQNEELEKKLAQRKQRLMQKRSMNNSHFEHDRYETQLVRQPMTSKGGNNLMFKRGGGFPEDELNEISMIKDSTNFETNQVNEESFNLELLKQMGNARGKKPLFSNSFLN